MASQQARPMLGKKAPGAPSSPFNKGQTSQNALPDRKKPDSKSANSGTPVRKAPVAANPNGTPGKATDPSSLKKSSPASALKAAKVPKRGNPPPKPPKPTDKFPVRKESEADGGVKIGNPEVPRESVHEISPVEMVGNEQSSIEEQDGEDGEQREGAAKKPLQASGSTGKSYFQRGKDAASGLANFATKANKLHSQLPEPVKEKATNCLQTGIQNVTTTAQPAVDEAGARVEVTEEASNLPTDLSALSGLEVGENGMVLDGEGNQVGRLAEGDPEDLAGYAIGENGEIVDQDGDLIGRVELLGEDLAVKSETFPGKDALGLKDLANLPVAEDGSIKDQSGRVIGKLVEGNSEDLVGWTVDENGEVLDDDGDLVGRVELISSEKVGDQVDQAKDSLDKRGNLLGRAEPWEEPEPEPENVDLSELEGLVPNKLGNVMGPDGVPIAHVSEGDPKALAGRRIDAEGQICSDSGEVIGQVTLIPEDERQAITPFGGFGDLVVRKNGFVEDEAGDVVGKIIEGNPQKLQGLLVDDDGDILDKRGNVKGRAEPYTAPKQEEEEEDLSMLEGMKVNKLGNVVDENGSVWGRITSGNPKKLAGKRVDAEGQIRSDDGKVLGSVELIPASEREEAEGIFYGLDGLVVTKDGTITDPSDQVVGRLVEGDPLRLKGRAVDEDGEVIDKVGNVIGRAEAWTPEGKSRDINPMSGRKVNREGEVRDEDGNLIGKLTEGNLKSLIGKTVDDNGYIVDNDGNKVGECTLLDHLPEPEPEEPESSAEEIEQQEKEEHDRELAKKVSSIVQQTLDSVEPLCKQITEHIERADRTPREELDEEQLVKTVKSIIDDTGNMLQECKGALRALDPDGQIAASAKVQSVSHDATSEEYQLADLLKKLSQTISTTIENGRQRIADRPHAKKKINPLWSLLSEPLFQIIAAVSLLLNGVADLLGNLLDGLGLRCPARGLLGSLGIDHLLSGLGLRNIGEKLGMSG